MGELSIKVTIANRVYPLTIEPDEEESVRKAASLINETVKQHEQQFAVKDKQDLLAMCALQYATEVLASGEKVTADDGLLDDLADISRKLADQL